MSLPLVYNHLLTPIHLHVIYICMKNKITLLIIFVFIILVPGAVFAATDGKTEKKATTSTSLEQRHKELREKKGNILNIILDKSPQISTTRGTLVVEAFYDGNDNKSWDGSDYELKDEVRCTVDDIEYSLPAFIPALDYNARYKISCVGSGDFQPTIEQKNVLVTRRGQVINMRIPCRKTSK
ncbi:MAG: hypothetical protein B6I36_06225 [Desulfobacteraceae bacterium 4572_35.1]|nr:MAG: hypothetical protein B6I36_06225 [Desulfobacteraceae bacterium 4572_35.1]